MELSQSVNSMLYRGHTDVSHLTTGLKELYGNRGALNSCECFREFRGGHRLMDVGNMQHLRGSIDVLQIDGRVMEQITFICAIIKFKIDRMLNLCIFTTTSDYAPLDSP